jgi:hypothetical protein
VLAEPEARTAPPPTASYTTGRDVIAFEPATLEAQLRRQLGEERINQLLGAREHPWVEVEDG